MNEMKSILIGALGVICLFLFMGQTRIETQKNKTEFKQLASKHNHGKYQIFQTIVDNKAGNKLLKELGLDDISSSHMILETVFDTYNNKVVSRKIIPLAKYF